MHMIYTTLWTLICEKDIKIKKKGKEEAKSYFTDAQKKQKIFIMAIKCYHKFPNSFPSFIRFCNNLTYKLINHH